MKSGAVIYATLCREKALETAAHYAVSDPFYDALFVTTRYFAAPLPNGRWGVKREWYRLGLSDNRGEDFVPLPRVEM